MKNNIYILNINASMNNTIVTVTNYIGKVIFWKSAGSLKFSGSKKSTPYAAQKTVELVCDDLICRKIFDVWVNIKGVGLGREPSIRVLVSLTDIKIVGISDKTPLPHNGCRPPKKRRI